MANTGRIVVKSGRTGKIRLLRNTHSDIRAGRIDRQWYFGLDAQDFAFHSDSQFPHTSDILMMIGVFTNGAGMNSVITFFGRPLSLSWSSHATNLLAILLLVAGGVAIAAITYWSYSKQLGGNRRRFTILIALRLLTLVLILFTALRPAYPVDEQPKIRTHLLVVKGQCPTK